MDILQRLRVVECATEIAGPYCTKLFADAGADVVKVEPPGGDPLRHRAAAGASGDAPLFKFLNAGKRSVVATPGDGHIDELLAGADLLVDSLGPRVLDHDELRRRHPWLVVVALSPYGYHGPYRDQPATEFTVQAESGSMATRGRSDRPPFQVGGRLFEWLQGTCAAVAAFAALLRAHATGEGELVDCSLMEACDLGGSVYADLTCQLTGSPPVGPPPRRTEIPSIEPTADGWVGFNTNTRQMFESFLTMIGRAELLDEDASWAQAPARWARADEWNAMVRAWTTQRTTDEIVELATLFRIPVAQVNNGQTVLEHPQFIARGLWADAPDGTFVHPLPPYRLDGERPRPRGPAPKLGEHQDTVEARPAPTQRASAATGGRDATSLPLAGVRVVDATAWWAGPASTGVLAALGAEVIHVESVQHPDGMRMTGGAFIDQPSWWERSSVYLGANANKENVTLDLASPDGRELFARLVEQADVLVENFSPRVFETFGITWDAVRAANPRIVMVRMPAFGLDGPWRDNVGFAQTMEQMTGLAWVTGYPDDQPRIPGGPCDPLAGMSAAFAALVGLERRRDTGHGCFIEVSMVESALNAAAEQVIEYTANGTVLSRVGNRSRDAAPQGLYVCRGDEQWLAVSVANDEQWQALRAVLGHPTWADDAVLDTFEGRRDAHDRIDEHLAAWAREHELHDAVALMIARGIPAAPLRDPRAISTHPQMVARGHFEGVDHPVIGRLAVPAPPFKYASVGRWVRCAAPLLGQHNGDVLTGLLGVDASRLDELAEQHVIGTTPIGLA